jgi:hypothetical protein
LQVKGVEVFKEFYETKTKHRKLTWIYSLGTCNLVGKFKPRDIELILTTYQASVLLLFNSADSLSYSDIKSQLNLTDEDVTRLLHSLSCAKFKILNKEPSNKTINQNDTFTFNPTFTNQLRRVKVRHRRGQSKLGLHGHQRFPASSLGQSDKHLRGCFNCERSRGDCKRLKRVWICTPGWPGDSCLGQTILFLSAVLPDARPALLCMGKCGGGVFFSPVLASPGSHVLPGRCRCPCLRWTRRRR